MADLTTNEEGLKVVSVSNYLKCLDDGMTREEMAKHFGIPLKEVKEHFQHPSLKGKKRKAKPTSILVDDTVPSAFGETVGNIGFFNGNNDVETENTQVNTEQRQDVYPGVPDEVFEVPEEPSEEEIITQQEVEEMIEKEESDVEETLNSWNN